MRGIRVCLIAAIAFGVAGLAGAAGPMALTSDGDLYTAGTRDNQVVLTARHGGGTIDELDMASNCGERALELAIEHDDQQIAKNCLFLLSEIAVRRGDTFGARRYLHELTAYYPEAGISEEIIDVFLATDLTTVVNLRG